jgi:virulence-associated protein VapD
MENPVRLTVIIDLESNFQFKELGFLFKQDWKHCELLVLSHQKDVVRFKEFYSPDIADIALRFGLKNDQGKVFDLGEKINSEFCFFLNFEESWNDNLLETLLKFCTENKENQNTYLYTIGFIKQKNGKVSFASEVVTSLKKVFKLHYLFSNLSWISPSTKTIFSTQLIRDYLINLDANYTSSKTRLLLFTIDYLAALFEQNSFRENKSDFIPAGFLINDVPRLEKSDVKAVKERIHDKKSLWQKQKWSKLWLKSKWYARITE